MFESRRVFLGGVLGLAATATLRATQLTIPPDLQEAAPPFPGRPRIVPSGAEPRRNPKAELKANQEHIKKDVARLTQLVADLQNKLDNADTKEVLSLDVIRKAEEIEKLAKQIRELVRG